MLSNKQYVDVSVVIPVYNSLETIERAVKSVAQQVVLPKEVIIVDDCSTDIKIKNKLDKVKEKFAGVLDIKIIYLSQNLGAASARNAGWDLATGKYVAFLDSDDVWHPQKLKLQYEFMEKNEGFFICFHKLKVIAENDISLYYECGYGFQFSFYLMNPIRKLFKHYPSTGTPSVMLRNNKNFRFKDGKRYSEDYLLWLEILFNNSGAYLDIELGAVFKELYGASGLSSHMWEIEKGELETFRILKDKSYIGCTLYTLVWVFSLLKYLRRKVKCALR